MRQGKTGRNDPCWCGSGKKFKKCHLGRAPEDGLKAKLAPKPRRSRHRRLCLSEEGREGMRAAGRFNAHLLDRMRDLIVPGVSLESLDDEVRTYTQDQGHIPACLGYKGFPKSCCTSVNEVVCHGIPDGYRLQEGDILNLDLTTIVDGWHGDQSETFLVGEVDAEARRLVQCTFDCLHAAIDALRPGSKVVEVGLAIEPLAHAQGYSVVEAFQGHGIGKVFHQDPGIPHYPDSHAGAFTLEPGMCFTIEPMINEGRKGCRVDRGDGWTARTVDGKRSAQFEHTLLMTEEGIEILTRTERGPRPGHRF